MLGSWLTSLVLLLLTCSYNKNKKYFFKKTNFIFYFGKIHEFWLKKQVEPKVARPQNKHFVKNIPTRRKQRVAFYTKFNGWQNMYEEVLTKHIRWSLDKTYTMKFISCVVVKMSCCHTFSEKLKWPRDRGTEGPGDT